MSDLDHENLPWSTTPADLGDSSDQMVLFHSIWDFMGHRNWHGQSIALEETKVFGKRETSISEYRGAHPNFLSERTKNVAGQGCRAPTSRLFLPGPLSRFPLLRNNPVYLRFCSCQEFFSSQLRHVRCEVL